jgi:hypothetical protein
LSKVYNPDSAGKDRNRLSKTIVLALRELMKQPEPNAESRDIAAYVVLALEEISKNIDVSVEAWEKRGYWVKADRFRLDWEWSGKVSKELQKALIAEDWGNVAMTAVKIGGKFNKLTIAEHHRLGIPWIGAYTQLIKK